MKISYADKFAIIVSVQLTCILLEVRLYLIILEELEKYEELLGIIQSELGGENFLNFLKLIFKNNNQLVPS